MTKKPTAKVGIPAPDVPETHQIWEAKADDSHTIFVLTVAPLVPMTEQSLDCDKNMIVTYLDPKLGYPVAEPLDSFLARYTH